METKFFNQCNNEQEVFQRAQTLAQLLDLTNPENRSLRAEVLNEYENLVRYFRSSTQQRSDVKELSHKEVLQQLKTIDVRVEVCGKWIWVHGNTKPHRDFLKGMKLRFSPGKKCWYWRPEKYRSLNTDPLGMDEIRNKYGSQAV